MSQSFDKNVFRDGIIGCFPIRCNRQMRIWPGRARPLFGSLTSGTSRTLHLGKRSVEIRRGNRWELLLGKRTAGKVIRALSWLGPESAPAALKQLSVKLPESEWAALNGARAALPSWMAKVVGEVVVHG